MPVKSTSSELAQHLRARREWLGWSQAKLAAKAGTTQQTIDRIENGQTVYSRSLPKISAALDLAEKNVVLTSERLKGLRTETIGKHSPLPTAHHSFPTFALRDEGVIKLLYYNQFLTAWVDRHVSYAIAVLTSQLQPTFAHGDVLYVDTAMAPQPGNFVIMFQLELSLIFEATVQFGRFKEAAGEMLHCETLDGQRIVLEKSAYNIDPIVSRHSRLDKTGDSPA